MNKLAMFIFSGMAILGIAESKLKADAVLSTVHHKPQSSFSKEDYILFAYVVSEQQDEREILYKGKAKIVATLDYKTAPQKVGRVFMEVVGPHKFRYPATDLLVSQGNLYIASLPTDKLGEYNIVVTFNDFNGRQIGQFFTYYIVVVSSGHLESINEIGLLTDKDRPGSKMFAIDIRLVDTRPGNYSCVVGLRGSNGQSYYLTGRDKFLGGNVILRTSADTTSIKEKIGVDGPYELHEAACTYENPPEFVKLNILRNLGKSKPYRILDF